MFFDAALGCFPPNGALLGLGIDAVDVEGLDDAPVDPMLTLSLPELPPVEIGEPTPADALGAPTPTLAAGDALDDAPSVDALLEPLADPDALPEALPDAEPLDDAPGLPGAGGAFPPFLAATNFESLGNAIGVGPFLENPQRNTSRARSPANGPLYGNEAFPRHAQSRSNRAR